MAAVAEVHLIKSVQFGVFSEQDILKMAVCEVTSPLLYNKETQLPNENGLLDPKMGVSIRGLICQTCFRDIKECPGHFGFIKLAETVFHLEFLDSIQKILQSVCYNCSKLLVSSEAVLSILGVRNKRKRLQEIKAHRQSRCEEDLSGKGCGKYQPVYRKKNAEIYVEMREPRGEAAETGDDDLRQVMRASEVYDIFRKIDDDTIRILGLSPEYSRPESLLIKLLVVAPPAVRPSIELSSSGRSEDDLTHHYETILSTNLELRKALEAGANRARIDELSRRLQDLVGYLMNNDKNIAKQKGGRPIKSISQRLKGKEGRLRGNLMGKRVDFSSRTVVSPDPALDLDQLGVPLEIAKELTIPETVTQLNIEVLKRLVDRGDEWPGARYYISKLHHGEVVDLMYVKHKPSLQYGDVVERHLADGDFVIFNRQPSLHKMSIMGHRVKVMPFSSFRLNLAVTTPYNADFDGDEMNMHVPQGVESKAEVRHLMHVPRQIVTPQSNRPVMGLNQDVLLGIRLFTFRDSFVDRGHLFNILMHVDDWGGALPTPAILRPRRLWSGKQVISLLLPPKLAYEKPCDGDVREELYDSDDAVVVRRGELLTGALRKRVVGNTAGSILGSMWIDFGPERTKDFMSFAQKVVNFWLLREGFTVGIADTLVPAEVAAQIEREKLKAGARFGEVLRDVQKDAKALILHQPGKTITQSFEYSVNTLLNDCRKDIGSMLNRNMSARNNIKHMITAGSKGNDLNISQICGIVGQQNVEGQRIPFGFQRRTLPHFLKDDCGPEARGFVANSYLRGLTPQEFFFHTMGGREGLIDTAVKTSQTGYMQRRLVKALEDVMVQYDATVRDSLGNIVEYVYGDDGIAGEFIEAQRFDLAELGDRALARRCCFFDLEEGQPDLGFEASVARFYDANAITLEVRDALLQSREAPALLYEEYLELRRTRDLLRGYIPAAEEGVKLMPVNLERILHQALYQRAADGPSDLSPLEALAKLKALCAALEVLHAERHAPQAAALSRQFNANATLLLRAHILSRLCSRRVVLGLRLSRAAFDFLTQEVLSCFNQAKAQPGEMIGSLAAQSIGETLTQMTLNTFHFAGVSSENITLGVPRIQEIINCSHSIKGASMMVFLREEFRFSAAAVQQLISALEFTTIAQIALGSEVYFDPDPARTVVAQDQHLIFLEEADPLHSSPWVLRVTIDPVLLARKGIRFAEILQKIDERVNRSLPIKLHVVDSLETADPIVLRVRIVSGQKEYNDIRKLEQYLLEDLPLKGFCTKVSYRTEKVRCYTAAGKVELPAQEFVLETSGTDLGRVLRLPMVDRRRTKTNHVWDIYRNLGIEAARLSILNEIRFVFRFFSIYVNYRHINLLADCITNNGHLMPISRTGINRVYQSPLRKASFEETVDILLEAALYADNDKLRGVTENVMFGQLSKMGTGCFEVLMDEDYLLSRPDDRDKTLQWRFVPEREQLLDVEADLGDEHYQKYMQTPLHSFSTAGAPDLRQGARPRTYDPAAQSLFTPMMTPQLSTARGLAAPGGARSPAYSGAYSPFHRPQAVNSPMIENPAYSPRFMAAGHAGQHTSELRFSPSSPHYNPSPNRVSSPGMPYMAAASPAYSHNSSSPYYSPNSVSPGAQSLLRMGESPAVAAEHFYEPKAAHKKEEFVKEEPEKQYSSEED